MDAIRPPVDTPSVHPDATTGVRRLGKPIGPTTTFGAIGAWMQRACEPTLPPMTTLRVGSVPYLVGRPLDEGLRQESGIELVHEVPARLVEGLRSGRLDVALVSSIELFRAPGYSYVPDLCVGTRGHVASVQVFLHRPLAEVRSVAMDPASRTSQALVQILLQDRAGGPPDYRFPELGQDPASVEADAWLAIGDRALREFHASDAPTFNPSQAWVERTGRPFVFAAWIVRPGLAIEPYADAFQRSARVGQQRIPDLAREAARTWGMPFEFCEQYLAQECAYDLQGDMSAALQAFGEAARGLGLTDPRAEPVVAWS